MTAHFRVRSPRRAGFTLIEMLAVLAILALVAGLSTQLARPPSPRLRLEAATRALCSAARATRMRAIATNEETTLFVDLQRKTFHSPVVTETFLPNDARIDLTVAEGKREDRTHAGIAFFHNGGSSGGVIRVDLAGNRATVGVNWLTGATSCELA